MSFSAEWLSLRSEADARARSLPLIQRAGALLGHEPTIVDLGAGTGATLFALSAQWPRPQRWVLVDANETLLANATERWRTEGFRDIQVTTRAADLASDPAPWSTRPTLVTASALFDLVSPSWIARFAAACAADNLPLLAMLSFDGVLELEPLHGFDETMRKAFLRHQHSDKGFGPAAGPDAPQELCAAFARHRYEIEEQSTPWELVTGRDDALIRELLRGWTSAARDILPTEDAQIDAWLAHRLGATRRLVVGHKDQLFVPPA